MQVIFKNADLKYIFEEGKEKGKPKFSAVVVKAFIKKVNILLDVDSTAQLRAFKSLHLEALSGNYKGYSSIRVNDQYRIIIKITNPAGKHETQERVVIEVIEIYDLTDYH